MERTAMLTRPSFVHQNQDVPTYTVLQDGRKRHDYAAIIPVINEGERIQTQLRGMTEARLPVDIILIDGGSTDGSTTPPALYGLAVTAVLQSPKGLSTQMRAGFHYALDLGYRGIISIDGNGKDSWWDIPRFVELLEAGHGYVQGSRYVKGGRAMNTPVDRALAVKFLHAPVISLGAGFRYTDTTNGFRGYSRELLLDPRVQPFRSVFQTYNLHYYLAVRAPRLGYAVTETPVTRSYPADGKVPTKISGWKGKVTIIRQMFMAAFQAYNPRG
jgi:glycosyltransferase involved in cell wall biosynthesis